MSKDPYSNVFGEWVTRVDRLEALTNPDGEFTLFTYDLFEILETCPPEHVKHYLLHFLLKVKFLMDEAIVLTNGQLDMAYQASAYKEFIHPNVHTSFATGLKQSSRISPNAKLSLCSWEGLEYLSDNKLKVSSLKVFFSLFT